VNNPDLTLAAKTRSQGVPDLLPLDLEPSDLEPLHLRRSGTSLLVDFSTGEAAMVHFGADLGPDLPDLSLLTDAVPRSALDIPVTLGLIPQASSGWRGRPGLRGHRNAQH
jgi:alpha-galactosidase